MSSYQEQLAAISTSQQRPTASHNRYTYVQSEQQQDQQQEQPHPIQQEQQEQPHQIQQERPHQYITTKKATKQLFYCLNSKQPHQQQQQ